MKITYHTKISLAIIGLLLLTSLFPLTSSAYGTSQQTAVRLSDTHVLFTITYRLGFLNRAAETPLLAEQGLAFDNSSNRLGYTIEDDAGTTLTPPAVAIVLAEAARPAGDTYALARQEVTNFTLVTIAELPFTGEDEYRLKVTSLPFTLIDYEVSQPSRMPADELTAFTTPSIR